MNETLTCPHCSESIDSPVSHQYPDTKSAKCPACDRSFRLGDARHVSLGVVRRPRTKRRKAKGGVDIAALFVSLLLPGIGHIIKSHVADGLFWLVAYIACVGVAAWAVQNTGQPIVGMLGLLGAAVIAIASGVSAFASN